MIRENVQVITLIKMPNHIIKQIAQYHRYNQIIYLTFDPTFQLTRTQLTQKQSATTWESNFDIPTSSKSIGTMSFQVTILWFSSASLHILCLVNGTHIDNGKIFIF